MLPHPARLQLLLLPPGALLCSPSPLASPFMSAKCPPPPPGRGSEFMSHLPRWRGAWGAATSGFTARRARPELGSSLAFQSRATQETHGKWHCIHTVVLEWPQSGLRSEKQSGPLSLGWVIPGCIVRDPGRQFSHVQNGPTTLGNTWHVVIQWYMCERLVFTPRIRKCSKGKYVHGC